MPAQSQQVNGLAVGGRTTLTFSNVYKFPGSYNGTITVDSTHVVKEVDETDNTAATDFVIPKATVDLTITGMSITPEEEQFGDRLKPAYQAMTVTQGVPNVVTVTVRNLGNSPSASFVTSWNADTRGIIVPGKQTLTQETGPLGPDESRQLTFNFTYPTAGHFRTLADVDAFKTVKETNEANNERILNVTVNPAKIELFFTTPIEFSPSDPVVGEEATASFTIRNYGPIATGSFAVQFISKKGAIKATQFIGGLNVGEEHTYTFPVKYTAAGSYTATAIIDPKGQVVKSVTPDEESQPVNVVKRSADLRLKLSSVKDFANPGGWQEWVVFLLAFQPHASCTIDLVIETPVSSKEFKKEFKEVECTSTGNTLREPDFNPGEKRATNAVLGLHLEENSPMVGGTLALNICQGLCLDIGLPGDSFLVQSRTQYLNPPSGEIDVAGTGCQEELNGGHCYDAFYEISLLGHVGMTAKAARAATTANATSGGGESEQALGTVQEAFSEIDALASSAEEYASQVGATPEGVKVTTTSSA